VTADPEELREAARRRGLSEGDLDADPFAQFTAWFGEIEAVASFEATAVALATAGADGRPAVRFVLLKGVDERGLTFFTNYGSPKARQLAENPYAALVFGWHPLARQVRVSGPVEQVGGRESDEYWATRPRGSQIGAWASPQSEVIAERAVLEQRAAEVDGRHAGAGVPRPPHWGGYRVVPDTFEFWQSRPDRLHDRFRYRRAGQGEPWVIERLAP
jgi:pyridoxamine 5'-phosphate oxidase